MNEETQAIAAGVPALAAGGSAFRLYEDRRATVMAAVLLLGGLACLATGFRGASKVELLFDPLVLAGICNVGAAAGLLARPHLARRRYRLRIQRSGGEPWNDPMMWSSRTVLTLGRRGTGLTSPRARMVIFVGVPLVLSLALAAIIVGGHFGLRAGPLGAVVLLIAALAVQSALRRRARDSLRFEVGFASFPCRVGEQRAQIQLTFAAQPPQGAKPPVATLQCVVERRDAKGWWTHDIASIVPAADAFPMPDTPSAFAVEFDIPSDAPPTDVLVLPAHSWQLVVSVETPSGWYDGAVAAPVFAHTVPAAVSP